MTTKIFRLSAVSFFLLALCMGCSTPMLVPDLVHVPLMQKQGDVHVQAQYGTNGLTGSLAVSPLPNVALLGSYSRAWSSEEKEPNGNLKNLSHGHELTQASLGGYLPSISLGGQNVTLELYGGMMLGTVRGGYGISILNSNVQIVDAKAKQVFVMLNVGLREVFTGEPVNPASGQPSVQILEYGSCFKFSNWQLTDFTYDGVANPAEKQEGNYLQTSIFARGPGRFLFWEFQVGFLYPVSNNSNRPNIASLYVSGGVHFSIFP